MGNILSENNQKMLDPYLISTIPRETWFSIPPRVDNLVIRKVPGRSVYLIFHENKFFITSFPVKIWDLIDNIVLISCFEDNKFHGIFACYLHDNHLLGQVRTVTLEDNIYNGEIISACLIQSDAFIQTVRELIKLSLTAGNIQRIPWTGLGAILPFRNKLVWHTMLGDISVISSQSLEILYQESLNVIYCCLMDTTDGLLINLDNEYFELN